jgi:hypothetical protein
MIDRISRRHLILEWNIYDVMIVYWFQRVSIGIFIFYRLFSYPLELIGKEMSDGKPPNFFWPTGIDLRLQKKNVTDQEALDMKSIPVRYGKCA